MGRNNHTQEQSTEQVKSVSPESFFFLPRLRESNVAEIVKNAIAFLRRRAMFLPMDLYTLHFDGSCGPKNPGGTAAYGFTLHKHGEELERGNGVIGEGPLMSNNVAEYFALCRGLLAFRKHVPTHTGQVLLTVRGDSMLVIKQMSRVWKARGGLYYLYYEEAVRLAAAARSVGALITFEWVPREHNTVCDDLSKAHTGCM